MSPLGARFVLLLSVATKCPVAMPFRESASVRIALAIPSFALSPHQASDAAPTQKLKDAAQELILSIRAGDAPRVRALLDKGVDVNNRDALGGTPLLEAAWIGNGEIVRLLLAHGADVNAVHRESGATPLKYAVLTSRPTLVQMLLEAGADQSHVFRDGQTILHVAAARNSAAVVELLLKSSASNPPGINGLDRDGNTALDQAVLHNQLAVVTCLLAHGADVNRTRPSDGRSALHEASIKGFSALVPVLIKAGANPADQDRFGQTALDLALAYKNANVISELLRVGSLDKSQTAADQAMETAVLKGQTEIVQILLKSGFDLNRTTTAGSTYLHDAALKNQARVARILIGAGARLDARNRSGATPLHDAALAGSTEAIEVLLDHGALIDARDTESLATPLMLAASLDRVSAVELLLRRGADPTLTDRSGHTALDRARMSDDPAIQRALQAGINHIP